MAWSVFRWYIEQAQKFLLAQGEQFVLTSSLFPKLHEATKKKFICISLNWSSTSHYLVIFRMINKQDKLTCLIRPRIYATFLMSKAHTYLNTKLMRS